MCKRIIWYQYLWFNSKVDIWSCALISSHIQLNDLLSAILATSTR